MFKKLILAAAALAFAAPVLADPHRKGFDRHGHGHRPAVRQHHHHYHPHRPVVVMPAPRVYYAPPPRVVYAPVYRPAPVYVAPPVYHSPAPYGGVSIRFNIPF